MANETDTTSEVARVLAETSPCTWSIPDPGHPNADACRHRRFDQGHGACWDVAYKQAAMLAEAGLLRDEKPARDPECSCAACDRGLPLPGDSPLWFPSRMNVCPDCGNKRCPKAADHAKWQCSGSNDTGQVGVPVEHPQIATQEPAEATQGGSGDARASGGLGERLRALGTGQTRTLRKVLRAMADEADRLENEAEMQRHSARSWRVQAEQAQGELRVIEGMSAR